MTSDGRRRATRARGLLVLVALLVLVNGGWMLFDGARALVVGSYVTPSEGPHAGQLGPWAPVVRAVGIEPRSTPMKSIFVVYGFGYVAAAAAFLAGARRSRRVLMVVAALGLWYLPFGTLINVVVLALLQAPGPRSRGGPLEGA